jgi:hypothetical protein
MQKSLRLVSSFIGFALVGGITSPASADIVTDWNETALQILSAAKLPSGAPNRILAMMHAAMFDAANSIQPKYKAYTGSIAANKGASSPAAISAAAYRVLVREVPAAAPGLDKRLQELTQAISEGPDKLGGLAVGEAAAQAILSARKEDGADFSADYVVVPGAGSYVLTANAQMLSPSLSKMKPFVLQVANQFQPPPPPPIDSPQVLRDIAEVKMLGGATSTQRTAEQAIIAQFHIPPGSPAWNSIARAAIHSKKLDVVDSARTMALLNFALMDAQMAMYQAKYHYNTWRPRTAIKYSSNLVQRASTATSVDWTPLIAEPMHPEYPCAHCGIGGAGAAIMEHLFGFAPFHFQVSTGALQGLERPFESFREYAEEEANSRLYGGVHFRWSNVVGEAVGRQIGTQVISRLTPLG